MNCKRFISIVIVVGVFGTCLTGISAMSLTETGEAINLVLRREMWCREEAFQAIIIAVIFDNKELINSAVPPLHKAKKQVEMAINSGEKIILPKNQDEFEKFIKLNDGFYKDFEALSKATKSGYKKVAKDQTHKLFDACVVCHERFRNNPKTSILGEN